MELVYNKAVGHMDSSDRCCGTEMYLKSRAALKI